MEVTVDHNEEYGYDADDGTRNCIEESCFASVAYYRDWILNEGGYCEREGRRLAGRTCSNFGEARCRSSISSPPWRAAAPGCAGVCGTRTWKAS